MNLYCQTNIVILLYKPVKTFSKICPRMTFGNIKYGTDHAFVKRVKNFFCSNSFYKTVGSSMS